MKKIFLIIAIAFVSCNEPTTEKPVYVQEKIIWTVTNSQKAKYSQLKFAGRWRGIPIFNRSVSADGYYYKEFRLKVGDTIHQNASIYISRENDNTIIDVFPNVSVKKYYK